MEQPVFVSIFIARSSRGVEVLFASAAAVDPANCVCVAVPFSIPLIAIAPSMQKQFLKKRARIVIQFPKKIHKK